MRPAPSRPRRWRRPGAAALVAVVALTLASCGTEEPVTPNPVTVTPTVEPVRTTPPEPVVPVTWPLTGVETAEGAARPAVAVKIADSTAARPQEGLDQADVVWEAIIDFDGSRLVAIFHSQVPEQIGPIRSVRPMDMAITKPYGGPLVYSGGQPGILAMVGDAGLQGMNFDYAAPGLYRVRTRSAPHNVYGSVQTFIDNADAGHNQPPPPQFAFARLAAQASAVVGGAPTSRVSFSLSSQAKPAWDWDAASGTWLRSEGSTPATVASGARIAATNVVAVVAPHPNTGFGAQNGAPVPTYELVGEGQALVATGGETLEVTWRKAAPDAPPEPVGAVPAVSSPPAATNARSISIAFGNSVA